MRIIGRRVTHRLWSNAVAIFVLVFMLYVLVPLTNNRSWGCHSQRPGWYQTMHQIHSVELALERMRTDASGKNLGDLFDMKRLHEVIEERALRANMNAFEASTEVYTTVLTTLLNHGRNAAEELNRVDATRGLSPVLNASSLQRLATSYLKVSKDEWGHSYKFFPGPWPQNWGPILFRKHQVEGDVGKADVLTVEVFHDGKRIKTLGLPADPNEEVYIWSLGPNGVSDQAVFDPSGKYEPPASRHYRADAPSDYLGGGDDVNNWDHYQSWEYLH